MKSSKRLVKKQCVKNNKKCSNGNGFRLENVLVYWALFLLENNIICIKKKTYDMHSLL